MDEETGEGIDYAERKKKMLRRHCRDRSDSKKENVKSINSKKEYDNSIIITGNRKAASEHRKSLRDRKQNYTKQKQRKC